VSTLSTPSPLYPYEVLIRGDAAGGAIAVWQIQDPDARIESARYDALRGWSPTELLSQSGRGPALGVDPAGNAIVAFVTTDGINVVRFDRNAEAWSAPLTLVADRAVSDLAVSVDGDAAVAWSIADRIRLSRYSVAADAWSAPEDVSAGRDPRVAIDAAGNVVVVSRLAYARDTIQAVRHSRVTGRWSSITYLTDLGGGHDLGIDAAGNATVIWYRLTLPSLTLQIARFTAATETWEAR
jgi:hypothetical protein